MNRACEICKGACCESIVFKVPETDEGRWLGMHATPTTGGKHEINVKCNALCGGKCSVWNSRPAVCVNFEVGGDACIDTLMRRRPNWQEIVKAMAPLTEGG